MRSRPWHLNVTTDGHSLTLNQYCCKAKNMLLFLLQLMKNKAEKYVYTPNSIFRGFWSIHSYSNNLYICMCCGKGSIFNDNSIWWSIIMIIWWILLINSKYIQKMVGFFVRNGVWSDCKYCRKKTHDPLTLVIYFFLWQTTFITAWTHKECILPFLSNNVQSVSSDNYSTSICF